MNQSLKGKRIAVLIANNYEDLELWYPTLRLPSSRVTTRELRSHR